MVASRTGELTPAAPFALHPIRPAPHSPCTPFESIEDLHVANIASQIKRNRQNEKRRLRNKSVRAELRTRTKNAVAAAQIGAEDSAEQLRLAVKRIDKAAARGVIHKNTAANHKSRLVRRIAALEAAAAEAAAE
jgi:small subunit ribosomal protein S20